MFCVCVITAGSNNNSDIKSQRGDYFFNLILASFIFSQLQQCKTTKASYRKHKKVLLKIERALFFGQI
jgi:hypothetical protein